MQKNFIMNNEKEIENVVDYIIKNISKKSVVLLKGGLGSGKTTFVKHFSSRFDINNVSSPSYNIIHIYNNKIVISHIDFYRLHTDAEIKELNIYENIEESDYTFIEWPGNIERSLRHYKTACIEFEIANNKHTAKAII
ncbi:tRNA (adenosine(37)-N6)-threonylcarbamoyltransferase complex ATPase subunit type 1 TsaE [candidate division WOR-3 bacterium]|nr:tRNA (adenosine(37)-N6)-threonylcarbamoyltransferase complex ATPase subunit type 1 TsaE [candidate division WOR-3 bacterium]